MRCNGNVFAEPLPSNDEGLHIQIQSMMGGLMKYAVEMGSGAIKFIPSFVKIGSGIQKFVGGGGIHRHTDKMVIS
jgi:hypothetical protein